MESDQAEIERESFDSSSSAAAAVADDRELGFGKRGSGISVPESGGRKSDRRFGIGAREEMGFLNRGDLSGRDLDT